MRYNQYHDQLVLSSSSDGHVVLASMASISSEPHGHLIEEEDDLDGSDGRGEYDVENLKLIRRCCKSCRTHLMGKNYLFIFQ